MCGQNYRLQPPTAADPHSAKHSGFISVDAHGIPTTLATPSGV
jgi:hypothetical protein